MTHVLGAELPAGWSAARLKDCTSFLNRGTPPNYADDGEVRAISQAVNQRDGLEWNKSRYHSCNGDPSRVRGYLHAGDTLVNSTGTGTLGRVGYFDSSPDDLPCMADGHVTVVRTRPDVLWPRFAYYWLTSAPFQDLISSVLAVGATNQIELSRERLSEAPVPLPPLEEQRRIADFLDVETVRADRLRAARERQLRLLSERELSLIRAEISGADTGRRRECASLPWIGSISSDWPIAPVYSHYDVQLGKMLTADRAATGNLRPYLRNANVTWYSVDTSDLAVMDFPQHEYLQYRVLPGDLLVCEGGAGVAESAVWRGGVEIFFQKSLHRVRSRGALPVEWLMYWLRLAKYCGLFASVGNVATIPHLTREQLKELRIAVPPDASKRVGRIEDYRRSNVEMIRLLRKANLVLAERRQALITAAVTGQIDVTTAGGVGVA
ncbi:restriction endonuclease subunit S [Kribbella sp. NPDC048915]|uniref:restriction endonuclease subunit S n=1 Tax=Kribbella sp. NPDC048915 TaxID=3155148 RepID=UPI0033DE7BF7